MKQIKQLKPNDVVELHWVDSTSTHGWTQKNPRNTLSTVRSIGFVVKNTPEEIAFTASYDHCTDMPFQCIHAVPWIAVTKIQKVTLKEMK